MTRGTFRRTSVSLLLLAALIALVGPNPIAGGAESEFSGKLTFRRGFPPAATDIWMMNADGSDLTRVSCNSLDDQGPAWSPNGKTIAFHTQEPGLQNIYLIDVGEECGPGTFLTEGRFASWSPGGERLAFDRGSFGARDVFVLDCHQPISLAVALDALPSCSERNLTNDAAARNLRADWSPDGQEIAFARGPEQGEDIWVMTSPDDPDDPVDMTQLTSGGRGNNAPKWSPSGKIVFQSNRDRPTGAQCPATGPCQFDEIYVMNADGSDQTRLTFFEAGSDTSPRWSPDGRHIVFQRDVDPGPAFLFQLFIMNADGSDVTQLTQGTVHNFPDWGHGRVVP